jgi:eukaryotic-like serine/threonine-protein kinase
LYGEALAIRRKLVEENPGVAGFRSHLAISLINIGEYHSQCGHQAESLESYRQAIAIQSNLAEENPAVIDYRTHLAACYNSMGSVPFESGHAAESLKSHRQALSIRKKLADEYPDVPVYQPYLATTYSRIGGASLLAGDVTGAIAQYRRAIAILAVLALTPEGLFRLACCQSLLAEALGRPDSTKSTKEAETMAIAAVSSLKRAIDTGYHNLNFVKNSSDFNSLRSRLDYRLLLMDLTFPAATIADKVNS